MAVEILGRLEEFWTVHNDCLHEYRVAHSIRTRANPMPDLRRRDALWETPFWVVHPTGERGGLFLERDGQGWKVESKDTTYGRLEEGDVENWPSQLQAMLVRGRSGLRPRALTLTMYLRRYLADLFVHGVGGGHYERLNEAIAQRFFDAPLGAYAVASATFCVTTPPQSDEEDVATLRRRLRDMWWNPQRFLTKPSRPPAGCRGPSTDGVVDPLTDLVSRKHALMAALATARRPSRRSLTMELYRVNAELRRFVADSALAIENRVTAAESASRSREAALWRGYPFFLHEPSAVRTAVANIFTGP